MFAISVTQGLLLIIDFYIWEEIKWGLTKAWATDMNTS